MSPEAMFNFHSGFIFLICSLFSLIAPFGSAQQRNSKHDEFSCPEEFGYYPHPTDCTQYYVCVFGGALLESCTGGLMYSHDLQTCDWPRNVGCGSSTSSVNNANILSTVPDNQDLIIKQTTPSWKDDIQQHQDEIPDRHLYEEEDLGPVEEIESDRQQRVYRGQPPTLGQVARDRDGIARHANALQSSAGPEKIKPVAVVSFGSHHPSLSSTQYTTKTDTTTTTKISRKSDVISTRGNGGYALRFRPAGGNEQTNVTETSSISNAPLIGQYSTLTKSNSSQSTPIISPTQNTQLQQISTKPTPTYGLIKAPNTSLYTSRPKVHYSSWSSNTNVATNTRYTIHPHSNPQVSGSSQFNMVYSDTENNAVNLPPVTVTDFSIINLAPKVHSHQQPAQSGSVNLNTLSHIPVNFDNRVYDYRPHLYTQPVIPASESVNFYNRPHHYRGNAVNSYYNSPTGPHFYSPPPPYPNARFFNHYEQPPDTSIVTLTYPKNNSHTPDIFNFVNGRIEYGTPVSTTPITTLADQSNSTKLQASNVNSINTTFTRNKLKNKEKNEIDDFENDEDSLDKDETDNEQINDDGLLEDEDTNDSDFDKDDYDFEKPDKNDTSSAEDESKDKRNDKQEQASENEESQVEYPRDEEEEKEQEAEEEEEEEENNDDSNNEEQPMAEDEADGERPTPFYKRFINDKLVDGNFAINPNVNLNSFLSDSSSPIKGESDSTKINEEYSPQDQSEYDESKNDNQPNKNDTNMTRKNDRIVRVNIYEELPMKHARATKPKPPSTPKRVVPLALVHSYKPANYSYPLNRYRLHPYNPLSYQNKNPYSSSGKTNKFGIQNISKYKPASLSYPSYIPSSSTPQSYHYYFPSTTDEPKDDSQDECTGSQCEEEPEEYSNQDNGSSSDDNNNNNNNNDENSDTKDNEEYYDDDYANDNSPNSPDLPDKMKNIDEEITAPPINFDEKIKENEQEMNEMEEGGEEANEDANDEETVSATQKSKNTHNGDKPFHTDHIKSSVLNHGMISHQQNKHRKPNIIAAKNNSTMTTRTTKQKIVLDVSTSTVSTSVSRFTTYRTPFSTPMRTKTNKNFDNKNKTNSINKFATETKHQNSLHPTAYSVQTNFFNPSSSLKITHSYTTPNKTKIKIDEDQLKSYKTTIQTQKPAVSRWPPVSIPAYIVEQSVSPIPTTPKSVYNVTKYDPYYNLYDDDQEIYHDLDYRQYNNQRKQQDSYQIIQEPHRLQPQHPQIYTDSPAYSSQDYKLQSELDGSAQQSEKLSTRLLLDNDRVTDALSKRENTKPTLYFPFVRSAYFKPVVDIPTKQLKLTASLQSAHLNAPNISSSPSNAGIEYESVRSYELNFANEGDSIIGETSQLPKVTRKYTLLNVSSATTIPSKLISTKYVNSPLSPLSLVSKNLTRDNFRIIVEPVSSKKLTLSTAFPYLTKTTPLTYDNKILTRKLQPVTDKYSTIYKTSQLSSTTYTPYSVIQSHTTPTSIAFTATSLVKSTVNPTLTNDNEKQSIRRFYIPRNDLLDRKLSAVTTNSPHVPRTESAKFSNKQITYSNSPSPAIIDPTTLNRNNSSVSVPPITSTDKIRSGQENEILYYDDDDDENADGEYYDDDFQSENNDNYIDNKITADKVSNHDNHNHQIPSNKHKIISNTSPKLNNLLAKSNNFSSTAVKSTKPFLLHKSYESSTAANKINTNTNIKHSHQYKELQSERCPQCNEKPFVRGRNRGSITYTTGEYDAATPSVIRTRPTLKPSTSIVSKVSEAVDIYKNPPRRPDPVYPTPQVDKAAAKCRKDICLLPDCSCGGKDIPGDLPVEVTPQLVLLTFDDSVNELNRGLYSDLFEKGRTNPNGCPIAATFYVSHEWTDYSMVQNLYAAGHEIASHSVSHSFGEQFSQRKWTKEIVGQREILAAYGGVRQDDIRGMRAPFLAVGGNKMFKMLYDANFTYDSSMPIYENRPPSWPYTLDYKLFHDCMIPPCPTRSYPGVWEVPMVMWQDLNGGRCSMGDACSNPPTADGVYKMLIKNFERHFSTNRAPFGLFYHSSWFTQPHHKEGFIAFLDTIVNMPEVWLVTNWQAIQWARDPTPISRLNNFTPFNCDYPERPRRCNNPKVCNLWHKSGVRYLKTCQPCPDVYPWTGKTGVRNSRIDNDDTLTD